MTAALSAPWQGHAECAPGVSPVPPRYFDADARPDEHREALLVCADCPVTEQCLAAAFADGDCGVRGGQIISDRGRVVKRCANCNRRYKAATSSRHCIRCRKADRS